MVADHSPLSLRYPTVTEPQQEMIVRSTPCTLQMGHSPCSTVGSKSNARYGLIST